MKSPSRRYQPGDHIGKWEVRGKLGAGAMGIVYDVVHRVTHKAAALKVLKMVGKSATVLAAKMLEEARLLAQAQHPNLVDVYDASDGSDEHGHWMVMEKLVGRELADILHEEGALPLQRALNYALQMASACSCAHDRGVVHRDLKPANVHVSYTEVLKVIDFGVSQFRKGMTLKGAVGTIPYMSPEQLRAEPLDGRSDVYSLGLVLHQMLMGRHVYQDEDLLWRRRDEVIGGILSAAPVSDFADVDERVRSLLVKALQKEREQRYASMDEFAADLETLLRSVAPAYPTTRRLTSAEVTAAAAARISLSGEDGAAPTNGDCATDTDVDVAAKPPPPAPKTAALPDSEATTQPHNPTEPSQPGTVTIAGKTFTLATAVIVGLVALLVGLFTALALTVPGDDNPPTTAPAGSATPSSPGSPARDDATSTASTAPPPASTLTAAVSAAPAVATSTAAAGAGPASKATADAGADASKQKDDAAADKAAPGKGAGSKKNGEDATDDVPW